MGRGAGKLPASIIGKSADKPTMLEQGG